MSYDDTPAFYASSLLVLGFWQCKNAGHKRQPNEQHYACTRLTTCDYDIFSMIPCEAILGSIPSHCLFVELYLECT